MAESKVVSIRIPQDLLKGIDRLAAERYPSRRPDGDPNRSQLILDALAAYVENPDYTVNNSCTVSDLDVRIELRIADLEARLESKLMQQMEAVLGESNA